MLGFKAPGSDAGKSAKIREVRAWVRELHPFPEDATIMITELTCSEPGCPPVETVVAVLREKQPGVQGKVHRALAAVVRDDVAALVFREVGPAAGGAS
jgi:hypothetical protein